MTETIAQRGPRTANSRHLAPRTDMTLDWHQATRALMVILIISWCARLALAAKGGQYFFPDESRFNRSLDLVSIIASGDVSRAISYLVARADHTGWILVGLAPALPIALLSHITGRSPEQFAYLAAMFLSLASVACIALTFGVARRLGASPVESLAAAALVAFAASFFYWSRHLIPYDVSMAFALASLWVGLATGGTGRSFAAGLLAGICFAVYNGYWTLAVVACAVQCLVGVRTLKRLATRATIRALGLALPTVALVIAARLAGQDDSFAKMREFAASVKQGDWAEGFTLPLEYLWRADRLLALGWMLAIVVTFAWLVRATPPENGIRLRLQAIYRRRLGSDPMPRALLLLACVAAVYACLAGGASIARVFVVYGRLARQLVPFLCLLTACVGTSAYERHRDHRRTIISVAAVAAALQLILAFAPPFRQMFPRELEASIFEYRPLDYALTVQGPPPRTGNPGARFVLVNADYLYPPRGHLPLPAGTTVLSFPHPLQYVPYQFEGFRAYERRILAESDISLRLIDRGAAAPSR